MNGPEATGDHAPFAAVPVLFATVAVLGMAVLGGYVRAVLVVPLHVPLDPNEGWNAYRAAAAMAGNPYPPANGFLTNNYPPLSFYVVGFFGSWFGDSVIAGRYVSLAAFTGIGLLIVIVLRRMAAASIAAVFAALLFAATLLLTSDYVGMNDPQLLGHAFQLAGLLMVMRTGRSPAAIAFAALFFVAGGFVKHNLSALPLATLTWLFFFDRRNAIRFGAGLFAFAIAGFLATNAILHVNLLRQLNSARTFSFAQMGISLLRWLPAAAAPLCAWLWLLLRARDEAVVLVSVYGAISTVIGTLLLGGAGVDVNALFDADIALALCAGLVVSRLLEERLRVAAQIFGVVCAVPFVVIAWRTPDWRDRSFWLRPMRDEAALAEMDIAFLGSHDGPAMCENLTFCFWAGKRATVDVFNLDQQFETGARDPGPFLQLIRSRYFRSIELDETTPFPFPKIVETALRENYRLDRQDDNGFFFVPR